MRIAQCRISKSVHDFPFRRLFTLQEYFDVHAPAIFFGCYDETDLLAIQQHEGLAVIWWCGQDARDFQNWDIFGNNVHHVTERLQVYEHMKALGINVTHNTPSNLAEPAECKPLGNKIFAYCPASYPEYHGIEIINELRSRGHDIILGDGSIPQDDWRAGRCNELYDQCYVGLVLSAFAGGGASVIELGLRGMKCVTNVIDIGNVIRWKTVGDVEVAIIAEAQYIGKTRLYVAKHTLNTLDLSHKFLYTEEYGNRDNI